MKRPFVPVALLYAGGLLLAEFVQPSLALLFSCTLLAAAGGIAISAARRWLIVPLIVLTGWTNLTARTAIISPHDLRLVQGDTVKIVKLRGTLLEAPTERVYVRDEQESW